MRDEALSLLKPISDAGRCEIGHHLHCWTTPPFGKEGPSGVDSLWLRAYQFELPYSLYREKVECLRAEVDKAYGMSSTSHRAGRWGIDQRSIDWLIGNGFVVDSSVVPLSSYSKSLGRVRGGPSFYSAPREPYAWHGKPIYGHNNTSLMEIPVTVDIPKSFLLRIFANYIGKQLPARRIANRVFKRVGGGRVLRPDPAYPVEVLFGIVDRAIKAGLPVLNLMLHSSELASGLSPFSRTRVDCERVWKRLEHTFEYVTTIGLRTASLSGAAKLLREKQVSSNVPKLCFPIKDI